MKKNYMQNYKSSTFKLFWCFLLLPIFTLMAQNLNFTIDTAIDNGVSITETIMDGTDTYVLTVFHSGNEELDNLGGGDLIFFHSAIDPLNPHQLTITKNGQPVNFNLAGIDYDTLEAGTISVTNQNGDFISSPTFYPFGAGAITITNPSNALSITQINIIPTDNDDLNDFGFHNITVEILDTLSIEDDTLLEQSVSVFPNPSNGIFTIKNSGIALDNIVVSDVNGRTISTFNLNGMTEDKTLDLSAVLSTGLYLITISTEQSSITKKLTIK